MSQSRKVENFSFEKRSFSNWLEKLRFSKQGCVAESFLVDFLR